MWSLYNFGEFPPQNFCKPLFSKWLAFWQYLQRLLVYSEMSNKAGDTHSERASNAKHLKLLCILRFAHVDCFFVYKWFTLQSSLNLLAEATGFEAKISWYAAKFMILLEMEFRRNGNLFAFTLKIFCHFLIIPDNFDSYFAFFVRRNDNSFSSWLVSWKAVLFTIPFTSHHHGWDHAQAVNSAWAAVLVF